MPLISPSLWPYMPLFTSEFLLIVIIGQLVLDLLIDHKTGSNLVHMLSLLTLLVQFLRGVEIGELDRLHHVR
jgi:hypothetical protein